jgi:DNA-directed RNA polymerase subunit RPC12/RpoP
MAKSAERFLDPEEIPEADFTSGVWAIYLGSSSSEEVIEMSAYTCSKCGMSVNITCAKCGAELVDESITTADGTKVEVSKCPNGCGKIKSPLCCGQDMSCSTG